MNILGGFGGKRGDAPAPKGGGAGGSGPYVSERDFEREVLRSEMQGKGKVVKVDVDKAPVIAQQLRVQSVPTFMVVAEGRIQDAVVGAIRKKKMQELVEPFFPRPAGALKPAELAQLIAGGAVVPIDTRDAAAFKRARLPRAIHM